MKKINAIIESNKNGYYSVYIESDLPFGVIGEGKNSEEAKQDFLCTYEEMRKMHKEKTGEDIQVEFEFKMDVSAFLQQYKGVLSPAGLSRLTGISRSQLSQYICGTRHPSPKTKDKIKASIQDFVEELSGCLI